MGLVVDGNTVLIAVEPLVSCSDERRLVEAGEVVLGLASTSHQIGAGARVTDACGLESALAKLITLDNPGLLEVLNGCVAVHKSLIALFSFVGRVLNRLVLSLLLRTC